MNYLSVASIVKQEQPYIREWLEFHIKQGVEKFYLYDNESTDGTVEETKPFEKYITWHKWPGIAQQFPAMNHCIDTYRYETEWLMCIDLDEFVFSKVDRKFSDTLETIYDQPGVSALAIHWLLFGSSGHEKYVDEPVIKRFTKRQNSTNEHIKSVVRLKDTISVGPNVHTYRVNGDVIDEGFQVLPYDYAISTPATSDKIACAHFVTKSREECTKRRSLFRADTGQLRSEDFFSAHDRNECEDLYLYNLMEYKR